MNNNNHVQVAISAIKRCTTLISRNAFRQLRIFSLSIPLCRKRVAEKKAHRLGTDYRKKKLSLLPKTTYIRTAKKWKEAYEIIDYCKRNGVEIDLEDDVFRQLSRPLDPIKLVARLREYLRQNLLRYSLQDGTFADRVQQVLHCNFEPFDTVTVCKTPQYLRSLGYDNEYTVINQMHIRSCLAAEGELRGEHCHDLPINFMNNVSHYLESPAMILRSLTHSDSIVIATDHTDKTGKPIIIALRNDIARVGGYNFPCVKLASAYGRNNFVDFCRRSLENIGLIYFDEKKSRELAASAGLQLPGVLTNCVSNLILPHYYEKVNPLIEDTIQNIQKRTRFIAADGFQTQCFYNRLENGHSYLHESQVTFPDGRRDHTCYDRNGTITLLERRNAQGCTTYRYSRVELIGAILLQEENYEYLNDVIRPGQNDPEIRRKQIELRKCGKNNKFGCCKVHRTQYEIDEHGNATENILILSSVNDRNGNPTVREIITTIDIDGRSNVTTREIITKNEIDGQGNNTGRKIITYRKLDGQNQVLESKTTVINGNAGNQDNAANQGNAGNQDNAANQGNAGNRDNVANQRNGVNQGGGVRQNNGARQNNGLRQNNGARQNNGVRQNNEVRQNNGVRQNGGGRRGRGRNQRGGGYGM